MTTKPELSEFAKSGRIVRQCEIRLALADCYRTLRDNTFLQAIELPADERKAFNMFTSTMDEGDCVRFQSMVSTCAFALDKFCSGALTDLSKLIAIHYDRCREEDSVRTSIHPHQQAIMDDLARTEGATIHVASVEPEEGIRTFVAALIEYIKEHLDEEDREPCVIEICEALEGEEYDIFADKTEDEMFAFLREAMFATDIPVEDLKEDVLNVIQGNGWPQVGIFGADEADDENYALAP